jgi:TetR/AcrR family transcriptional repressor of mexJK operon
MTAASRRRAPRLTRDEQREQKSKLILEGAWVTFCEKGYEATTIDDVAAYAGVSRMPVYWLFGDKQGLFIELWRHKVDEIFGFLTTGTRVGAPLRRNLAAIAKLLAEGQSGDSLSPDESLYFVVQTIALNRPDIASKLLELSNQTLDRFTHLVTSSTLAEGEELRGPPAVVAAHVIAMINGLSTVRFQTHRSFVKAKDLTEIFVAIAFRKT